MEFTPGNIRAWSRLGMSGVIGLVMEELAVQDSSLAVLTADLSSYAGLGQFAKDHPEMYYNTGIAEQNMIGIACGMASEGLHPYAMSYASFAVNRCFDQIRCGMGYMNLPVRLIGMASGYSIGILGATHIECNDVGLMSTIPNMTIVCPADAGETAKALIALHEHEGPAYLRLTGGAPCSPVYKSDFEFTVGKANWLSKKGDILIVGCGSIISEVLRAAKSLKSLHGIEVSVLDFHTLQPFDKEAIASIIQDDYRAVFTVEEHSAAQGLGGRVRSALREGGFVNDIVSLGSSPRYEHACAYGTLLEGSALDARSIVSTVLKVAGE